MEEQFAHLGYTRVYKCLVGFKASSQYDARLCVVLICETQKFIGAQRNARIDWESYPCVPLRCILASDCKKWLKYLTKNVCVS
jgi:hypothetical protein